MKIKIYLLAIVTIFTIFSCSEDVLNTEPTDKASGETVFETTENAYTAMNGIYRAFYVYGSQWVDYYETENSGIAAMQLANDLMAEDVLMDKSGSGWFWYDYRFWVRAEVNSTGDRPYSWWNMHYQLINNANYVLANIDNASGLVEDKNNIKAQAYALRAYCYFNLIRLYQRTYVGHQGDPGVPLYTEPSNAKTEGKGRGTVEEVYTQINADLDSAIARFQNASDRRHISHINLNVAHGFKARVALTQENWATAQTHAALAKAGITLMSTTDMLGGFNTVVNSEWMWASEVNEEQSLSWPSFWSHVDASVDGSYANRARRCIFSWLYNQIPATDVRKQWFNGIVGTPSTGPNFNYNQHKFEVKAAGSWASDLLYMRASEMYLIEAEAQCRLGNYPEARTLITSVIGYKDSNPAWAANLAAIPNGNTLTLGSTGAINNLLDYIILQRRIELWGEGFRGFDVQRLKTGFTRAGYNHPVNLAITDPESWEWIMMIPQKEFDGNKNMNSVTDQNP